MLSVLHSPSLYRIFALEGSPSSPNAPTEMIVPLNVLISFLPVFPVWIWKSLIVSLEGMRDDGRVYKCCADHVVSCMSVTWMKSVLIFLLLPWPARFWPARSFVDRAARASVIVPDGDVDDASLSVWRPWHLSMSVFSCCPLDLDCPSSAYSVATENEAIVTRAERRSPRGCTKSIMYVGPVCAHVLSRHHKGTGSFGSVRRAQVACAGRYVHGYRELWG